ncbi:hypothetical protein ACFY93_34205 [Streptomyces sp. NPDC008313]|uniref:hypothetical protein n=1 Tax=Streptomyces sp. NPDC008313 TaxID=3364826 RepID=UPI0036E4037C
MDFDALHFANFKLLDDAVEDWSTMVGNLKTLQDDAEKGLRGAANKADWAGVNATVSKEFIGKTTGEFADAHTQATSIRNILRDTRNELKDYHRKLHDALERGRKKHLTVSSSKGGGFVVKADPKGKDVKDASDASAGDEKDVTALRDEIQRILDDASESDNTAGTVLQALVDQTRLGFSDATYKDRDAAADAVEEADELARLAKKDPDDLSVSEFDRLSAGLKKYRNDDLFAERFAVDLGPKKTMEFWAGINDPQRAGGDLYQDRRDHFDDLQRNLSMTLANATQSDTAAMSEWKSTAIDLGDKPLYGNRGGPMGFQVMSNLMRVGDYDDQFLHDYGTQLMATERKLTDNGAHGNGFWQRGAPDPWLNRIGEDSGSDPLTGYLKGLSNSPDAATDFFNEQYISKDDEDNPFERDTDGNGKKGKVSLSNFDYLFEERDWPQEMSADGDELHTGKNNLALALEAATTGHPAGELPTVDTPAHNAGQAKLFEDIVASISDDNERLTNSSYMSDSMGQIASEYLPDINRAMTDDPKGDTNRLFPLAGSQATLEHRDVTRFLFTVGQNPEGYAAVEVSQKAYMANLMDYHLDPNLPEDQQYDDDAKFTVEQVARGSGEVSGTLSQGRAEVVAGEADVKDKAYEYSVAQRKNLISGVVGTGVGMGTTLIASPAGGAAAGGGAGTVASMVLEEVFKDAEGKAKDDAGPVMGEIWDSGVDDNTRYTKKAAELAAEAHQRADLKGIGERARTGTQDGFRASGTNVTATAADLKTEI